MYAILQYIQMIIIIEYDKLREVSYFVRGLLVSLDNFPKEGKWVSHHLGIFPNVWGWIWHNLGTQQTFPILLVSSILTLKEQV